jgi:hypothetical protein
VPRSLPKTLSSTAVENGIETDRVTGGRYLDRFGPPDGVWKIAQKVYIHNWNMKQPGSAIWDRGMYAQFIMRGGRTRADPSYAFFAR